jgi:hypothetical protein
MGAAVIPVYRYAFLYASALQGSHTVTTSSLKPVATILGVPSGGTRRGLPCNAFAVRGYPVPLELLFAAYGLPIDAVHQSCRDYITITAAVIRNNQTDQTDKTESAIFSRLRLSHSVAA